MSKLGKITLLAITMVALVVVGLALSRERDNQQVQTPKTSAPVAADEQTTAPAVKAQPISWHHTLPEALAEAKTRKTFILVDFHADWCGWCTKLDQDTLSNAEVQARLRDFTLLKIDTDKYPDLAQRFNVTGLPTTAILDANSKVIFSQSGYMVPKEYLQFLAQIKK